MSKHGKQPMNVDIKGATKVAPNHSAGSSNSKKFKSQKWKEEKRQRHVENLAYRAQLHTDKANSHNSSERLVVQTKIDEISKRGAVKKSKNKGDKK